MKKEIKDFCNKYNLSEEMFYGEVYFDNFTIDGTDIPEGFCMCVNSLTIKGPCNIPSKVLNLKNKVSNLIFENIDVPINFEWSRKIRLENDQNYSPYGLGRTEFNISFKNCKFSEDFKGIFHSQVSIANCKFSKNFKGIFRKSLLIEECNLGNTLSPIAQDCLLIRNCQVQSGIKLQASSIMIISSVIQLSTRSATTLIARSGVIHMIRTFIGNPSGKSLQLVASEVRIDNNCDNLKLGLDLIQRRLDLVCNVIRYCNRTAPVDLSKRVMECYIKKFSNLNYILVPWNPQLPETSTTVVWEIVEKITEYLIIARRVNSNKLSLLGYNSEKNFWRVLKKLNVSKSLKP